MLPDWYPYRTHSEIVGRSQYGKSKFIEWAMREHVITHTPFCLLDWHGTTFWEMARYLAYLRPKQPVYVLNFSDPHFITPLQVFQKRPEEEPSAYASRHTDTIIRAWGAENTDQYPNYDQTMKMLFTVMAHSGCTLSDARKLLIYPKHELREWAAGIIPDPEMKQQWLELNFLSRQTRTAGNFEKWNWRVGSTERRLARFTGSKSVRLFTSLPGLDINHAIDERAIVLMNLTPSWNLSYESARVLAMLVLSEFFTSALNHTGEDRPFTLFCDESQNYADDETGKMLDQVLKTGLRLCLVHHHAGQFRRYEGLRDSLAMNAGIKLTFGGLTPFQARAAAEELFFPELNERWKKEDKVHYVTYHYEEPFEEVTVSASEGYAESDDYVSETGNVTESVRSGTRFVPSVERIVDGQEDFTMEEKLSKLAQRLTSLPKQHCYVKLPDAVFEREVPWIEPVLPKPERVIRFLKGLPTIPLQDAERIIQENERAFLERSRHVSRPSPKKKPPTLHKQG